MTRKSKLYVAWGIMYVICTILGFINTNNGLLQAIFALVSMGFFLPGGVLLYEAVGEKDKKTVHTVRYLTLQWLR